MNTYSCKLKELHQQALGRGFIAKVEILEPHKVIEADAGAVIKTSKLKSIDFERGIIVTQNSIYLFTDS